MPKDVRALLSGIAEGATHDAECLEVLIAEKSETLPAAELEALKASRSMCQLHAQAITNLQKRFE